MGTAYVKFDESFCTGCSKCIRACLTKALRMREGRLVLNESLCIGCGECIRACPEGAVTSAISCERFEKSERFSVAIVSPILYPQFQGVMPCDVLQGLNRMGFDHVIDLSCYLEMYQFAAEESIARNHESGEAPWPLISPICPVVCRLIALKYPNLLSRILPLKRPVGLIGKDIRRQIGEEFGVEDDDIEFCHLTPCPSKMASADMAEILDFPCIDRVLGINDIYPQLISAVEQVKDMDLSFYPCQRVCILPNARALMWGMSGGEIAGIDTEGTLAVSGLREVMHYIEKIEIGLFQDIAYMEFRACQTGCLGGSLTAVDKYLALSNAQKMIKMFGLDRRFQRRKLRQVYDQGWFHSRKKPEEKLKDFIGREPLLSIEQMQRVEQILEKLPGNDCGACGAPDCRTFAEDVVRGYADLKDCYRIMLDTLQKP